MSLFSTRWHSDCYLASHKELKNHDPFYATWVEISYSTRIEMCPEFQKRFSKVRKRSKALRAM
jgi:hypothetical protein